MSHPDPAAGIPSAFEIGLRDHHSHFDLIELLALLPFASGAEPWSRSASLDRVRSGGIQLPEGAEIVRHSRDKNRAWMLARGKGWTVRISRWFAEDTKITVTAVELATAERILAELVEALEDTEPPPAGTTEMGFWYWSADRGGVHSKRRIEAVEWSEAHTNYSAEPARQLSLLMAMDPEQVSGRLLLLHGPPGTGKTSALRSLALAWRDWCQIDCVLDPERLFDDAGYLIGIAMGEEGESDADDERWRLLVLEDCDELIRADAKFATGQSLARLLNLTDGMLGQGRKVLVAITTNEDLGRLHPAIVRPGRCLARIEVGPLSRQEAGVWLDGAATAPEEGATLAELYALRRGGDPLLPGDPRLPNGNYL
ncbi:DUF5925 domain-containing protein [Streptomyces sp. NPDC050738]|uniref:DUF5925 domain-containing protein n=1 Tax=Streptomyces sp. NPDC050738 TaxID=3154744 RepID=UPI0034130A05